jgi:hypothetical protein
MTCHQYPIVVMSFNRPDYLEAVLQTLVEQIGADLDQRPITLFQDGWLNPFSKAKRAREGDVRRCEQLFRQYLPAGTVYLSPYNLGIALNFERAETHAFEVLDAEAAIFLEDDLLLSPHYINSLDHLIGVALHDERIGHVAVYGDHHTALPDQMTSPEGYVLLEHNWGFGLTRRQWSRNKFYVEPYLNIVRNCDYIFRNDDAIRELYASWGMDPTGNSQDVTKTLACCLTGSVKLNTNACLGKYIGAEGIHMNQEWYDSLGYANTELYPAPLTAFGELSDECYRQIFSAQMNWATGKPYP